MNRQQEQKPLELLRDYFGHDAFRPSQKEAIDCLLSGRDLLAVMPTGAGKSVCYQIPALMAEGVTLVISPLVSLMKDQVTALVQNGVPAAYFNSLLTSAQQAEALRRGAEGRYKLIYVAPERLTSPAFLRFCQTVPIAMVTVDEAHCVSQWGQDFRPSYLEIAGFIDQLPRRPVVSAFTATATQRVRRDIIELLKLQKPHQIVTSFDRKNLYFEVRKPKDKNAALLELVRKRAGDCGIIYCQTRKAVEAVCELLQQHDIPATRYHAGLTKEERLQNQEDFLFDRKSVMVATNAFGMGIDKSNVSYIIHYNMPTSLENYYQEAGRAGRDGSAADCILLYSPRDVDTARFLIQQSEPAEQSPEQAEVLRQRQFHRLGQMKDYCTQAGCLRRFLLDYFGEKIPAPCGNCSGCLAGWEDVDVTKEAQKLLSCVRRVERAGYQPTKDLVFQILRGEKSEALTLLQLDRLSTFGILDKGESNRLEAVTRRLLDRGLLQQSGDASPVLSLTDRAKPLLAGRQTLTIKQKRPKPRKTIRPVSNAGVDAALFDQLREVRKRLANRAGVPAYVVFSDATLRDMCQALPTTRKEFLSISGVSNIKCQRYAGDFLPVIRQYRQGKGH
ncbi:MAG: DNA helicase RecQ [Clostridiales bacterium]|nr:DNA helicase RecQ [Clostridiales bacterium]